MINRIDCCRTCTDRTVGCHATCVRYIEAVRKGNQLKQKFALEHQAEAYYLGFMADAKDARVMGRTTMKVRK